MSAGAVPYISEEEYLAAEARSRVKHEYYDGRVWPMAAESDVHELVSGNVFGVLWHHLHGKGCWVFKSRMKVRLSVAQKPLFYYPDVMVVFDAEDSHELYKERPKLIVEVLSADEEKDLVEKLLAYQRIEWLVEYMVVSPRVEAPVVRTFRRAEGWESRETLTGMDAEVELRSVGLTMRVAELFAT
jgi:Uma2 family endonuclease